MRPLSGGQEDYAGLLLASLSLTPVTKGPVVRVAPNDLSFNTVQSWKDIYDFRPGHRPFVKSDEWYENGSFAGRAKSIVTESDPEKHGNMRRSFSRAFSLRSLAEQETVISTHIDNLVRQIGALGAHEGGVDLVMWFHMLGFDVISELALGKSFNSVVNGK